MAKFFTSILFIAIFLFCNNSFAQKKDSTVKKNTRIFAKADPAKRYNPRIAIIRSAIIPGWGQVTNKKYWKVPIVYAALGITTYIFFNNVKQYNENVRGYIN